MKMLGARALQVPRKLARRECHIRAIEAHVSELPGDEQQQLLESLDAARPFDKNETLSSRSASIFLLMNGDNKLPVDFNLADLA